jgi:hypothetical protein
MRARTAAAALAIAIGGGFDSASAQTPRAYVAATVGAIRLTADAVNGSTVAAGGAAGFSIRPWLDVEGELVAPAGAFTRSYGDTDTLSVSYASAGSSQAEIERLGVWLRYDHRRDITASASAVAIFHTPIEDSRITPGLIVGLTWQRARHRTDYTPLRIGSGLDPTDRRALPSHEVSTRTLGGLTVGVNLAVTVTRQLAIVPDLRYDYGSIGDEINNTLRSSVRAVWRF